MNSRILADIRQILADLYPDELSIRRIASDSKVDISRITFNSTSINTWYNVITEAEKNDRVATLLDIVAGEYGNNREFQNAYQAYQRFVSPDHNQTLQESYQPSRESLTEEQLSKYTANVLNRPSAQSVFAAITEKDHYTFYRFYRNCSTQIRERVGLVVTLITLALVLRFEWPIFNYWIQNLFSPFEGVSEIERGKYPNILKTNALELWAGYIQKKFVATGKIRDNSAVMMIKDIPQGLECEVFVISGKFLPAEFEEWQLICSKDDPQYPVSIKVNGIAVFGLTGGSYYSEENPLFVSGTGAWPDLSYQLLTPVGPNMAISPLKSDNLALWITNMQKAYGNKDNLLIDNDTIMRKSLIPEGVICKIGASGNSIWSRKYERWLFLCTTDNFRKVRRELQVNGVAARGVTGGDYYDIDDPLIIYGTGKWSASYYEENQAYQSDPLKPKQNALDLWATYIQNKFNRTGVLSDNSTVMVKLDIPQGIACGVAAINSRYWPKQYEEWRLACSMDDFRSSVPLTVNGTAARGITGGAYYTTDNPFTVYGTGVWPDYMYESSLPSVQDPASNQNFVIVQLKVNALELWAGTVQNKFNTSGRLSDNITIISKRDIPQGIVCDVAAIDSGYWPKQYEEWRLVCSMDNFRSSVPITVNGIAARGLTGGSYYGIDNPFTVYGTGIWPDGSFEPIVSSEQASPPNKGVSAIRLKINSLEIWAGDTQQKFNASGRLSDNTLVMSKRDIPQGIVCDVAAIDSGYWPKQYEEWRLACSADNFRISVPITVNGTAARGLTGGAYYAVDNPFTVYGTGVWPDGSFEPIEIPIPTLTQTITPTSTTPIISTRIFTSTAPLSVTLTMTSIMADSINDKSTITATVPSTRTSSE